MKKSQLSYGKILLLPLAMILITCIRQFEPMFTEYEDILVVDGIITNEKIPHTISLSRSYPLDKRNPLPELGAEVSLVNANGESYFLKEYTGGSYKTDTSDFTAGIGDQYKLHIVTKNGETFESDYEEILPVPIVDSLNWEFQEKVSIEDGSVTQGVQFFINTHNPEGTTRYYKWEFLETWEFRVPFVAEDMLPNRTTCWQEDNPGGINIASSEYLAEDRIASHPIYFVTASTNRLAIAYSLLVKQYALKKETYSYWYQLNKINYQQGSLYDAPPAQIPGNLKNITHPEKPVLGYFQASGVTTCRVFVMRDQLPKDFYVTGGFSSCTIVEVPEGDQGSYYRQGYVFVSRYYNSQLQKWMIVLTNSIACIDCTVNGSNIKPSFWPQ
jgi:hypothetical protein